MKGDMQLDSPFLAAIPEIPEVGTVSATSWSPRACARRKEIDVSGLRICLNPPNEASAEEKVTKDWIAWVSLTR